MQKLQATAGPLHLEKTLEKALEEGSQEFRRTAETTLLLGGGGASAKQFARHWQVTREKRTHAIVMTIRNTDPRAWHLEFGTKKSPELPWFGPSVAMLAGQIVNRLRRVLKVSVRSSVQRTGKSP